MQPQASEDTDVQSCCYSVFYGNQKGLQSVSLPGKFTKPSSLVQLSLWRSAEGIQPDNGQEPRTDDKKVKAE